MAQTNHDKYVFGFWMVHGEVLHFERFFKYKIKKIFFSNTYTRKSSLFSLSLRLHNPTSQNNVYSMLCLLYFCIKNVCMCMCMCMFE